MVNTNDSWYQYPNRTDTESLVNTVGYINRSVEGLFGPIILFVIWIISFVGVFSATGSDRMAAARGFTFASFFCAILSTMMVLMGFLNVKFMWLLFIFTAVGALWIKLGSDNL